MGSSRKQLPLVKNSSLSIFVLIVTTSLNITSESDYAKNSIGIWNFYFLTEKVCFFVVSSTSVKKDLSITEDSLMGSVFSIQSGFQFLF